MAVYFGIFCLSLLASYGDYYVEIRQKNLKIISFLLASISILVISALAGYRDYTIGTDVMVYGNPWFQNAVGMQGNFFLYTKWAMSSSIGCLYATFNYIVAHFTNNPHWFYFWYSLVENSIIYLSIKRNKDIISPPLGWAVYLFMFYNMTLNVLRNGMAFAIILWGLKYIREQKLVKYLVVIFIAYQFHNTAVIAIVPYFVYYFFNRNNSSYSIIKKISIVFITMIIVVVFTQLSSGLTSYNLINGRYDLYTQSGTNGGFLIHLVLTCVPLIVLYVIQNDKDDIDHDVFESYLLIATILGLMNKKLAYLSRITLYFDIYFIISIPFIISHGRLFKYKNINLNIVIIYIYLVIYWILVYGYMNSGETVPYIFMSN